ncbi:MAG: hypothetical protein H7X76_06035 [Prolixibacteraceae bacterium]|nr:hypothetical protein [Burkholderiales bacterium]
MIHQESLYRTAFALLTTVIVLLGGCSKSEPPNPPTSPQSSAPVKNLESLPSGNIQEGARTMNQGADLARGLEQQKQDRDKEAEAQNK